MNLVKINTYDYTDRTYQRVEQDLYINLDQVSEVTPTPEGCVIEMVTKKKHFTTNKVEDFIKTQAGVKKAKVSK